VSRVDVLAGVEILAEGSSTHDHAYGVNLYRCDRELTRGVGAERTCDLRGGVTIRERWQHASAPARTEQV